MAVGGFSVMDNHPDGLCHSMTRSCVVDRVDLTLVDPARKLKDETTRTTSPDSLVCKPDNLTGHQASIDLILVSAPPALMATFTASSIGSFKGTSIRSRPCS